MLTFTYMLSKRKNTILIISGSFLSTLLVFNTTLQGIIVSLLTLLTGIIVYRYLCQKHQYAKRYFCFQNSFQTYFSLVCSGYLLYMIAKTVYTSGIITSLRKQTYTYASELTILGLLVLSAMIAPAVFTFFNWINDLIGRLIKTVFSMMDTFDKAVALFFIGTISSLLIISYSQTSVFSNCFYIAANGEVHYRAVDVLLDTDSPYILHNVMNIFDVNARHIFFSGLMLPITIPATLISSLFAAHEQVFALCMSFTSSIILLITAIILSKLAKERYLLPMLLCSYPYIFYSFVFERNQLAVMLLVISVTLNMENEKSHVSKLGMLSSFGLAAGATTSSILIGGMPFFKKSFREYIRDGFKAIGLFVVMIIIAGKAKLFLALDFAISSFAEHSNVQISLGQRLMHYTESIQSMLLPSKTYVKTVVENGTNLKLLYNTVNRLEFHVNCVGLTILCLALIGYYFYRKQPLAKVYLGWIGCHILIFPIIGFSGTSFLLHAIMFSWAYLILAYQGLKKISQLIPPKIRTALYILLIATMLVLNFRFMYQIYNFGVANYPMIIAS